MQSDKAQAMLMALWLAAYGDQSPPDALHALEEALKRPVPRPPTESPEPFGGLPVWLIEGIKAGYLGVWSRDTVTTETSLTPSQIAALASTRLIHLAVQDKPSDSCLPQLLHLADEISQDFYYALLRLGHVMGWGSYERALMHLSPKRHPYEQVVQALYCVMKAGDSLELCVEIAMRSEQVAVGGLAGAVMGARMGSMTAEQQEQLPHGIVNRLRALGDWLHGQKG